MYRLSHFATLFLVSASVLTAHQPCKINKVHCDCSRSELLRCTLSSLSELGLLSEYLKDNAVPGLSFTFSANRTFPSGVLPSLNFTELIIYGIDLTDVTDEAFAGLEGTLKTLRLRYGRFEKIPIPAITRLEALKHLDMEDNQIRELHQSLRGLNLSGLSLTRNRITSIGKNVLPWTLEDLGLKNNNLSRLNRALKGKIKFLDISDNRITSLDRELDELPELLNLDASRNRIQKIGEAFGKVPKLQKLSLSSNKINMLYSRFERLRSLQHLDISRNELNYVSSKAFSGLERLRKLNLSFNQLGTKTFPEGPMDDLMSLEELDISSNKLPNLTFLPFSFTEGNGTQKWLRMIDSGITCDEVNEPIIRGLEERNVSIEGNPC